MNPMPAVTVTGTTGTVRLQPSRSHSTVPRIVPRVAFLNHAQATRPDRFNCQSAKKKSTRAAAEQKHIALGTGELEPVSILLARRYCTCMATYMIPAKAQQEPVPCYASVGSSSSVLSCVAHEVISYIHTLRIIQISNKMKRPGQSDSYL
jgi:hypothetical protein